MNATILCHEPWAGLGPARPAGVGGDSYLGPADLRTLTVPEDVCAVIPAPSVAAVYDAPVPVDVPMLFVNGDIDPQDPPANVAGADRTYPASLALVAVGESHQFAQWAAWPA